MAIYHRNLMGPTAEAVWSPSLFSEPKTTVGIHIFTFVYLNFLIVEQQLGHGESRSRIIGQNNNQCYSIIPH